jgi:hypothetical protein
MGLRFFMDINHPRLLTSLSILLLASNILTFTYFYIDNVRLREVIERERSLYEEAVESYRRMLDSYTVLNRSYYEALEMNKRLEEFLMYFQGKLIVPYNYTVILEAGAP